MIVKLTLLTLIILAVFNSNAQKLKKKVDVDGFLKEVYFIQKKTTIREGKSFILNTETKDTISIGEYRSGARIGEWKFAYIKSGEPYLKYDYDEHKLLFIDEEVMADSFLVWNNGTYEKQAVERPLLYLGYNKELASTIAQDIDISFSIMQSGKVGFSLIQFNVDEKGDIIGTKLLSSFSKEIDQKINTLVTQLPGHFLPALQNAKPVKSAFFVRVNIGLPRENFKQTNSEPFIEHVDILYGSPIVQKRRVGGSIQGVSK